MSTVPDPAADMRLRALRLRDLPAVAAIETRAFGTPWPRSEFAFELAKPSAICIAAVDRESLAGYVISSRQDRVRHIRNVAVDPTHRRRGIGRLLLRAVLDRAAADEPFVLDVRESALPAISLYEGLGFRVAGRRPSFYRDNGEDALIMWLAGPDVQPGR